MKKLKSSPSFHCLDMQKSIDNLCEYTFVNETFKKSARIYLYRTRLNMAPNQVSEIFGLDPYFVNCIASKVGKNKPAKLKQIEDALKKQFPDYLNERYKKHLLKIADRINNTTLDVQ